ncbi:hypothetical protein B7494_g5204 [Chlorociboria aeruginascens]|nr:hypothetical protein B7494_g5204 [Chlorociboria aeruginascens]
MLDSEGARKRVARPRNRNAIVAPYHAQSATSASRDATVSIHAMTAFNEGKPDIEPANNALSGIRRSRIITGKEVLFTPESIAALQSGQAQQLPSTRLNAEKASLPLSHTPLRQLPDDLKPTIVSAANIQFLGGFDPFSILPNTDGEPIKKQALIHYFLRRLAPWLSYLDDEATAASPKISWLPFALHHPALFYATLLTAAVHLNRFQPVGSQQAVLWYKVETMRLANEKLMCPAEAAKDEMIIVVLVLLYFNVGGNSQKEYEMHLNGIHQMLKVRGGKEKLGMRGMLRNWLNVCHGPWADDWEYIYPM